MKSNSLGFFDDGNDDATLATGRGKKLYKWRGGWITDQDVEGLSMAFKVVARRPEPIMSRAGDPLYRLFEPLFSAGKDKGYLAYSRHGLRTTDHLRRLLRAVVDRSEVQLMKEAINVWIALRFYVDDEDELRSMYRELHDILVTSGDIEAIYC